MAPAIALAIFVSLLLVAAVAVWRRPVVALYVFVVGLAAHNLVMALLYGAGVRGVSLDVIQAWKETLLAVALTRVARDALRSRRLPFRFGTVDVLALAFAAVVVAYALVPQSALGGDAGPKAILYGLRHALIPVVAFLLGRSLVVSPRELRRLGWTVVGAAAAVAAFGLVEEYTVPVEWWRGSGAVGYFRDQLGFDYHGPGGLPDNFAFNSSEGLFRRLVSTFISPLGTAFMLTVALLLAAARGVRDGRRGLVAAALAAVTGTALLFTLSRSSLIALAGGFCVLAWARRRVAFAGAAAATLVVGAAFALVFTDVAPRTHFFKEDLPYQMERARERGKLPPGSGVLSPDEPSIRSHLTNLRDGLETVVRHPQGYGLGNAGATAARFDVPLRAGESNYTEIGVETGVVGLGLFVAWNLALLAGLLRAARVAEPERRWAAAGLAAALAAVLALAVQTDAYGVPWLAYCVWWLGGSLLEPAPLRARAAAPARARTTAVEQA